MICPIEPLDGQVRGLLLIVTVAPLALAAVAVVIKLAVVKLLGMVPVKEAVGVIKFGIRKEIMVCARKASTL